MTPTEQAKTPPALCLWERIARIIDPAAWDRKPFWFEGSFRRRQLIAEATAKAAISMVRRHDRARAALSEEGE